jgi:hypothetical protein
MGLICHHNCPRDFPLASERFGATELIPSYRQPVGQSMYAASMLSTGNRKKGKVRFSIPK